MTDIPEDKIDVALRSPQLSLFLFQFSDYVERAHSVPGLPEHARPPRSKEKML